MLVQESLLRKTMWLFKFWTRSFLVYKSHVNVSTQIIGLPWIDISDRSGCILFQPLSRQDFVREKLSLDYFSSRLSCLKRCYLFIFASEISSRRRASGKEFFTCPSYIPQAQGQCSSHSHLADTYIYDRSVGTELKTNTT